jgi:hypothetical protein
MRSYLYTLLCWDIYNLNMNVYTQPLADRTALTLCAGQGVSTVVTGRRYNSIMYTQHGEGHFPFALKCFLRFVTCALSVDSKIQKLFNVLKLFFGFQDKRIFI